MGKNNNEEVVKQISLFTSVTAGLTILRHMERLFLKSLRQPLTGIFSGEQWTVSHVFCSVSVV